MRIERINKARLGGKLKVKLFSIIVCVTIALSLMVIWSIKYVERRQLIKYQTFIWTIALINQFKTYSAIEQGFTNGYPITIEELSGHLGDVRPLIPYVAHEGLNGGLVTSGNVDAVYILNPVGVPAKLHFLHSFLGHPAGSEITGPCAEIMVTLGRIDHEKERVARVNQWENGHAVTFTDLNFTSTITDYYGNFILYTPNPIGVSAKARVLHSWQGLPVNTEIIANEMNLSTK